MSETAWRGPDERATEIESGLVARLRCPLCASSLACAPGDPTRTEAYCSACGARYPRVDGVWRMLTDDRRAHYAPFLKNYPLLRRREGWERDPKYYLSLPDTQPDDPAAAMWRIRRRSLRKLEEVLPPVRDGWALDLGAGTGWLSSYLTRRGFHTVALDLTVAGNDSLAGAQIYHDHDGVRFGRVQASMDSLPFADGSFALCVLSGSLHYADAAETLAEVRRVLLPGGMVAITDSPVYTDAQSGRAMADEQRRRVGLLLDGEPLGLPGGEGFLLQAEVASRLRSLGFAVRVLSTGRPLGKLRRRARAAFRPPRREEALFPVIVATKAAGATRK